MKHLTIPFLLIPVLATAPVFATPSSLPVAYTMNAPFVFGGGQSVVTVYQGKDIAVAQRHTGSEPDFFQLAAKGHVNWAGGRIYIDGARTDGRLAHARKMAGRLFVVPHSKESFQEGKRYPNPDFDNLAWSAKHLSVSFRRGSDDTTVAGLEAHQYIARISYDFTRFDSDSGEKKHRHVRVRREFWFAPALSFSPLQLLPLSMAHRAFTDGDPQKLADAVYARLKGKMQAQGMLVRARLGSGTDAIVIQVADLLKAPALDAGSLEHAPVVPSARMGDAEMPLFMYGMLQKRGPRAGSFTATLNKGRSMSGQAGFTLSSTNDLVLAATFTGDNGAKGMLVLLRPCHGLPSPGRYAMAPVRKTSALRAMSQKQLQAYARKYQVFVVVQAADGLTVLKSAGSGHVTISKAGDKHLAGRFRLSARPVVTPVAGSGGKQRISGKFDAAGGLDLPLRSKTARLLRAADASGR